MEIVDSNFLLNQTQWIIKKNLLTNPIYLACAQLLSRHSIFCFYAHNINKKYEKKCEKLILRKIFKNKKVFIQKSGDTSHCFRLWQLDLVSWNRNCKISLPIMERKNSMRFGYREQWKIESNHEDINGNNIIIFSNQ